MSKISAHVLDTARGRPAADLSIRLDRLLTSDKLHAFRHLASAHTDAAGRVSDLLLGEPLEAGTYRVHFETEAYFTSTQQVVFYPYVEVVFRIADGESYHIPLLLSPFGYSTYRGS
ncbi:MAG: uraH [Myxococcaceae bacterium]|nr:uraH [Myxococcaceae bacterium]